MMRRIAISLAAFAILAPSGQALDEQTPHNQLSEEEIAEGWILLFDGDSKYGWRAEDPRFEESWVVHDGVLTCNPRSEFNHLRHNATFADFHLKADFRVNTRGNSGIFFRAGADGKPFVTSENGDVVVQGYEAQIDDNDPRGLMYQTGALYNDLPARQLITGENQWRSYEIIANGDRLTTKINGETVADGTDKKFRVGHIGLQHHHPGNVIEFRNIKLKPLGLKPIFNGTDLQGWKVLHPDDADPNARQAQWSVRDGMLHVEVPPKQGATQGGKGQLETEGQYGNFLLQLDARTNGKFLNSGIFFRALPGQMWQGYESQIHNQWLFNPTNPIDYGTGGIYRRVKTRRVTAEDEKFFTKTILAYGPYIATWVNGYPVCEFVDTREPSDNPRNGYRSEPGAITIQAHDPTTNLDFRNIGIAELPSP